eukprot:CAMPEP_0117445930 /NCGR_PEP_ID=MMETSP0759-20121206/6062_1 /TAXON_ID=63605 /ORGANISM="Percolomonas cosmopolitus, Strain WS" /LENGTH=3647 /DNA_ID=CAMNT_0005238147 /DNA_START=274 /DNA_END=11217 /DNA_ORIENTATION=-
MFASSTLGDNRHTPPPSSSSNDADESSRSLSTSSNTIHTLFMNDCSDFTTLCQLDEFRKDCFIPATVFEEIELYSLFDIYHSRIGQNPPAPSSSTVADSAESTSKAQHASLAAPYSSDASSLPPLNDSPLRKAIKRLYLQALYEDDKGSPLVSFQLIVNKRLQILDKFQHDIKTQCATYSSLKAKFEQLPLSVNASISVPSPQDDSRTMLHKQLQRAMSKSDTKKGLFSQFKKSRHETIYKVLAKNSSHPLSMIGVDTENVRDYLLDFCCNTNQQRRKRLKSYSSLIFLALGHGSLDDILKILHATLSLSPDPTVLSDYETEEHGIVLRPEVLKALQRFQQFVQSKEAEIRDNTNGRSFDSNGKALFPHQFALPISCKKPLSVVHMFSLFIHYLDVLNRTHDNSNLLLQLRDKPLKTIWQEYTIELKQATFENLKSLIDKLVQMTNYDSVRTAAVLVCFRVLKLNVRALSLWHNGSSASLSRRMKYLKGDFVHDLKEYILAFLREQQELYSKHVTGPTTHYYKEHIEKKSPHHPVQQHGTPRGHSGSPTLDLEERDDLVIVTPKTKSDRTLSLDNIGDYVPQIFESITEVLCHGFTLFFPDSNAQIDFIRDALENASTDPVKKLVARYLVHKFANDVLFFDSVILKGLNAKDTQNTVEFMRYLISFIKVHTLHKIKSGTELDTQMESILHDCTNLLLLWQTNVFFHVGETPVKQRRSTIPKVSLLNDAEGKSLFEYIGLVLQCCSRLCVEACGYIDDTTRTHVEKSLKDGFVGKLVFPLLQNIIKLLWRSHNSAQERQSVDLLFQFIYPHVTDLLRTVNSLNIMIDIREPIFEWRIVETCHPYQTNSAEELKISFPALNSFQKSGVSEEKNIRPVAVTVKFDPRCRTACQADNLRITSSYVPQNADVSPSLQFSGHGSSIPVNPLVSWGETLSASFRSDDKQTDWGMKLAVFPLYHFHWLYEFEKYLGWIGGRFATFVLSEHPHMTKLEQPFETWLQNRPFFYGALNENADAEKPTENSELSDVMGFLNGIMNLDNVKSVSLVDFMKNHLRAESMMLHDQDFVIKAERGIIASILYHSNLVGLATEFNAQMMNQLHQEVPKALIQVWRQARNIRMWMVQSKQMHQTSYDALCQSISQKVKFLLTLSPGVEEEQSVVLPNSAKSVSNPSPLLLQDTSNSSNSPISSVPNPKFSQVKGAHAETLTQSTRSSRPSKSMKNAESVDQINKLRKMKQRTEETEIHNVDQISKVILNFVKSDVAVNDLSRVMTMRTSRAMSRAQALRILSELFECTQYHTVKAEVLKDAKYILRSKSFNNDIDFHYLNNTEGCGLEAHKELTSTFESLIKKLIVELDNWPSEDLILSGMLREIMEICFFSFKPCDVEWVLRFRFLEKICPLMYDSPAHIEKGKLQAIASLSEEKREVRKRAWKIFRMLSVRCVEMLEQWDEKEQFQIPPNKRDEVRAQIDDLRDKIFGLLFDELEEMIRNNNIFSDVLEEMLSLMVSLCNTASAQICLSSKRFQRLLLPLLRVGIPKVQELSLQLCSQLILNSSSNLQDEKEIEDQNSLKLLHVLFDFLGSYQMTQILGKDHTSSQRTLVPLHMAKEIFNLLRKLFHESAPVQWRSDIRLLMESNIHDIPTLISLIDDKSSLAASETIKRVLATLTILSGFSYVPSEGENILVRLNGKWEAAKVCSMEENRHSITFLLTEKRYLNKTQRIESEKVKTLTDHCLDPKVFELSDAHINDICAFISASGIYLYPNKSPFQEDVSDASLESQSHTLLKATWMYFLRFVHRLLDNPVQSCKPQLIRMLIDNFGFLSDVSKMDTNQKYGHDHKLDCCSFAFTGKQFTRQYYYSCITCGMSNTKAVCAYCARTCHRGHRLGKPELGEFYCDCGAGEGKNKCRSLKKSALESEYTVERMESLLLRLHNVMPLYQEISKSQQNSSYFIGRSQLNNPTDSNINHIIGPTRFVIQAAQTRTGYVVNASTHEISFSQANSSGFSMIGTDYCIPKNWHGFYFEVEIVDCGTNSGVCIGISEKLQCNKPWPQVLKSSYSLFLSQSNATLYKGTSVHKAKYGNLKLHQGDIVGCGYSKDQGHIFFTRNGKNLGHAFDHVPSSDGGPYFPTLVMRGDTARLRANLGQTSFLYNVSEAYSAINSQKHDISTHFDQSTAKATDNFQCQIKELRTIGFYDKKRVKDAVQKYGNDANAVVSYIHRSSVKPLHQALVEKMRQMGFEQHMCFRALKMTGNDIQRAIDLLIEGQVDDSNPSEDEIREYETDLGHFGFLGTETFQSDFDQELSRGMLQNPDVKVNTAAYTDVDIYKVSVYDLIVINPHISPSGKSGATNHTLYPLRSRIGVVIRKLLNGAYVQTFDPQHSTYQTNFVGPDDLRTCPPEFSDLTLNTIGSRCVNLYRTISIMYCREILTLLLQQMSSFDFGQYSTSSIYELLKVLVATQYNRQHHNVVASSVKMPKKYRFMLDNMQNINNETGLNLLDYVAHDAKADLVRYAKTLPQTRKIIFRNEINARPQHLRIFGASSIYLKFAENCQLQTQQDVLIFTYDRNGRKIARLFKGPLVLPKHAVIHGSDELWFHFKVSSLQEGAGFEFYATGGTHRLPEQLALSQPNLALASSVLEHVSARMLEADTAQTNGLFADLITYLTVPFAPFKVSICHALHNILDVVKQLPTSRRPSLEILKRFRLELEQLRKRFDTFSVAAANPLPVFHAVVDWFSALRLELVSDVCCNVRGATHEKHHIYQYKMLSSSQNENMRKVRGCASCMTVQVLTVTPIENSKYYGHGRSRCELNASNSLQWYDKGDNENLFPIHHMNVNPGDWFEHLTWIDQLAIVRQLSEYFMSPESQPCPDWALYEAALETKKKVQYRESEHPYKIINDEGMIRIPGAKTLFISFDKHSQTHRCDKLCFSAKYAGAEDLGLFSGEELKDKTLIVHGNTVHYKFKSDGGDHECTCNHCGKRIIGVRFHCTVCDDFDLCSRCIRKIRVHHETHVFLKIRRPVDCVPASLPLLYTSRWANSAHYRSNNHYSVKCNACGKSPIVGVRYWCENCEDYNLCEKCAEDEYLHHDRMHVFLRVLRPLPPKNQMPLNALPYGLVYEKELDTHWGYLFSVSSTDANYKYSDPKILQLTQQIESEMQTFSPQMDADLVRYIESHCKQGWQSLEWNSLRLVDKHLIHHPFIKEASTRGIRYRFIALKLLNRKISRIMHLLSFDEMDQYGPKQSLTELISKVRNRIFHSVKMDAWNHSVHNSLIEINPISMHLNRHLAAEESKLSEQSAYNSLFNQAFKQAQAINPRVLSRKGGAWKITFVGESADDYGGPFRESLNQICTELQSLDQLDLLIPIPNREEGQGENREKFMPNPRALTRRYEKWYNFFGILIGVGLLSKNVLPLDLPSIFWKHIVHERVTTDDLSAIDQMQFQSLQALKYCDGVTPDTFNDIFFHNFVIAASDGTEIELIPNGRDIPVTYDNRMEYVQLAEEHKLHEIDFQMKHVLRGLYSIIPPRYFPIFTWTELERLICGDPQIDLKVLKKHTIYEGYTAQSKQIKDFWSVMQKFTQKERSMYLRFVWGRSRLPVSEEGYTHPMKIQKLERANPDQTLPLSHTCFFSLELPAFSSKSVLRERLLFAITYCRSIDTDTHQTRLTV